MLPNRFVESSCVKCHHEMTDLIRDGSRVEAPKLMRGYNLVKDNGCFGCHEIAGIKGGRRSVPTCGWKCRRRWKRIGRRARQDLSDPLNPPGNMRKVGPSLRRISEKTNAEWMSRWIRSPRDFRPDTKMPHFYGLSNNHPDMLPAPSRQDFPDAEIQAIVHYLLNESGSYLKTRTASALASEQKQKELQELVKTGKATEPQVREAGRVDAPRWNGTPRPPRCRNCRPSSTPRRRPTSFATAGELFSERGCLACHINEHTVAMKTPGKPDLPAIHGDGQFGPNLTRIAAKLGTKPGDEASARRWLVQWILNPSFHIPRTWMPITHLTPEEANDVASWLLSQQVKDWPNAGEPHVASADLRRCENLATVFLSRAYTRSEVEKFVKEGIPTDELNKMGKPLDADERELERRPASPKSIENKLKMYIGKKAISQLGCFGCHDIPGFETAKPIGTPLNDWGKKDPERLAFEDVTAYALRNYQIVPVAFTDKDGKPVVPDKPMAEGSKQTKELYEKYFFDLLEHHQREGFLYQKLTEPRSYDYQRLRAWDDRLRMPQFRFARAERREKETDEEFAARQQKEEAEAREAVMTFILGLVAEPPPAKFVHHPAAGTAGGDQGRQVLEKFNCGGCHLVRPGVYEFKLTDDQLEKLQANYKTASRTLQRGLFLPRSQRLGQLPAEAAGPRQGVRIAAGDSRRRGRPAEGADRLPQRGGAICRHRCEGQAGPARHPRLQRRHEHSAAGQAADEIGRVRRNVRHFAGRLPDEEGPANLRRRGEGAPGRAAVAAPTGREDAAALAVQLPPRTVRDPARDRRCGCRSST